LEHASLRTNRFELHHCSLCSVGLRSSRLQNDSRICQRCSHNGRHRHRRHLLGTLSAWLVLQTEGSLGTRKPVDVCVRRGRFVKRLIWLLYDLASCIHTFFGLFDRFTKNLGSRSATVYWDTTRSSIRPVAHPGKLWRLQYRNITIMSYNHVFVIFCKACFTVYFSLSSGTPSFLFLHSFISCLPSFFLNKINQRPNIFSPS